MMRSVSLIILNTFPVLHVTLGKTMTESQEDTSADRLVDKFIDTLFSRAPKAFPLNHADLDDVTLGKPGQLAMSQRVPLVSSGSWSASHPFSAAVQVPRVPHATNRDDDGAFNRDEIYKDDENAGFKKMFSIRPKAANVGKAEELAKEGKASEQMGFRYDKALNKWVRDDTTGEKVSDWKERGGAIETPLTGVAYTVWPAVYISLLERKMKQVTPKEALQMVKDPFKKAVIVDVDSEADFLNEAPEGAVNVPLFTPVAGNGLLDNVKKLSSALMFMQATERNPKFAEMALERLPKNRPIIVGCQRGGSMETTTVTQKVGYTKEFQDPDKAFGIESRSLKACYELFEAGFTDVYFLKGGITAWRVDNLPMQGAYYVG